MKKIFLIISNIITVILLLIVIVMYAINATKIWIPGIILFISIIWNWYMTRRYLKGKK